VEDHVLEGAALGNLGNTYSALAGWGEAKDCYAQSLKIASETGDQRGEANSLFNLSVDLHRRGDEARAREYAEAALGIFTHLEDPNVAKVERRLALMSRQ
jgi:hypothetical protein